MAYYNTIKKAKEAMTDGLLPGGTYDDRLDVHLWLPEMNSMNVTIKFDKFFEGQEDPNDYLFMRTGRGDMKCLSLINLEKQSSGFTLLDVYESPEGDFALLQPNSGEVKDDVIIPDMKDYDTSNVCDGFVWSGRWSALPWYNDAIKWFRYKNYTDDAFIKSHPVSIKKYDSKYLLNFTVEDEFELAIYAMGVGCKGPRLVFSKGFCCK